MSHSSTAEIDGSRKLIRLKKRQLALLDARESLLRYCEMQMPDTADLEDPDLTRFVATPQARLLCKIMEDVEAGRRKRVAVSIGPQLGKSEILSRRFPAWCVGRDPYRNLMLGTYNQTFAEEFGGEVRGSIESPLHQAVFPEHRLQKGALDLLITDKGGKTAFVGVGGSGTGKPADFFIVDDPIRSDDDAQSQLYRDRIWKWFNAVVFTRCHSRSGIVVVHCLTGDTRITMGDGTRKRLDAIRVGDEVAAYEDGRLVRRKVLNFAPQGEDDVFVVKTGSSTVRANARHPFAVLRDGGVTWVRTDALKKGDIVLTTAVEHGVAECEDAFRGKPITAIEPAGRADVFDIQVEGAENFIADGMVVHNTRWHTDDLIGRLVDPDHPERNKEDAGIAEDWEYINLPAVVEDPKLAAHLGLTLEVPTEKRVVAQFGVKPMSALWPDRKGLEFLAEAKRMDARTFNALYMGRPTAEDGEYFKANMIVEYGPEELPPLANLKIYGASDHAVTSKQERDPNVLGCVGVDENEDIWILPDLVWRRMQTDLVVEELLRQFKDHRPQLWWMESELISKSFGPFLHKRMIDERIFVTIDQVVPSKDKQTRARAIQGRMSMRKVRFPRFAPWFADARREMLQFPYGAHDDFVDWLAHIGMGLIKARGARIVPANANTAPVGSIKWIMESALARGREEKRLKAAEGW